MDKTTPLTNCKNCGAILTSDVCEYCGTIYVQSEKRDKKENSLNCASFNGSVEFIVESPLSGIINFS